MANPCPRPLALERLVAQEFDLLVIGAGIIGARVALEAALAGLDVALVDARDFGAATSSASSKLVHGGLRYLRRGDVRLVRESHAERRALLTTVAPHLVHPLDFLLPVYGGAPDGPAAIGVAMLAYAALSGFRKSRAGMVTARRARTLAPALRTAGMRACGVYRDAQTNDSRLVLATVTAAAQAGAVVLSRAPVLGLDGGHDGLREAHVVADGVSLTVRFRASINAAGPWVDDVRRLEDAGAAPMARLSKGVHVTVPLPADTVAALAVPMSRTRVTFAVPWEGVLLLGTTDRPYGGDPDALRVEDADIEEVLREASVGLEPGVAARARVLATFAGLRVLPLGDGDVAEASREHLVRVGRRGMVSVAGGKLTTHRRIALDVLRRLPGQAPGRFRLHDAALPGAGDPGPRPAEVEPETWAHLVHVYGADAREVSRGSLRPIQPGAPEVWAQVAHAIENEWAAEPDDVLRRRTALWARGVAAGVEEAVAAELARPRR